MKLRILIIGVNYAPEVLGIAPYNTQLAEHLAGVGHEVSVLTTFPYYPQWTTHPAYRHGAPFRREVINGVKVLRSPVLLPRKRTALQRVLFDSSLAATALVNSVGIADLDVVICVSPPLQLGVTGWLIARSRRARFLLHLQDIVPDAAIAVGLMQEGSAARVARYLELFVYGRANHISVISDGFVRNLADKRVSSHKLSVMPNWVETSQFDVGADPAMRVALGVQNGETLVVHAGNIGAKQGLETVVDAAAELAGEQIVMALVGDGNSRQELEERASRLGLSKLRFFPIQADFPATLAAADVLVLSQRAEVLDSVAPSKLLSYMAAGKPVVACVHERSEAGQIIRDAGCGVLVPPDDPRALAAAVRMLHSHPDRYVNLGQAGRRHVAQNYERLDVLGRWSKLVAEQNLISSKS